MEEPLTEDMLAELNYDNIPNFEKIDDRFKNLSYDPENKYTVPYTWGTLGIIYNTKMVDEPITSWDAMFDEKYAGQVLMINNSRDALGIALMDLGYSVNTDSEDELRAAYDLLAEAKKAGVYQAWVMDEVFDKMEAGEAAVATYYAGDYLTMLENNPDLGFYIPEEGTNTYVDAMCILKGAKNKENAEKFINFLCRPDIAVKNFEYITYATPNKAAKEMLDEEIQNNKAVFPDAKQLKNCEVCRYLGDEADELYNSLWKEVKSD